MTRQLEQWNARHKILAILKTVDANREKEEIKNDDYLGYEAEYLELRQRWLTEEGKGFLAAIIAELKSEKNCYDPTRKDEGQPGLNFSSVILNGKKFTDFYYVHQTEERKYRDIRYMDSQGADLWWENLQWANIEDANPQGASLSGAKLQGADIEGAKLQGAFIPWANLQEADLKGATLQGASIWWANLQGTILWDANLQGANLWRAKLQGAFLWDAKLQGADFNDAVIAGPALKGYPNSSHSGQEIDDLSADFTHVEFSREWRGPLLMALFVSIVSFLGVKIRNKVFKYKKKKKWKRLAWRKWIQNKEDMEEESEKKKREIELKDYPKLKRCYAGRPTTFFGMDTSRMDASKNPGLKRYIEDEQYIEDFKEKHRVLYWFWAMSSDCGRCLSLWAFWSFIFAAFFAVIYWGFPKLVEVSPPLNQYDSCFPGNLLVKFYFSVVTFTTLGFGDLRAATWLGTIVVGLEVVLGYFFLGGLVAILASKLARRA